MMFPTKWQMLDISSPEGGSGGLNSLEMLLPHQPMASPLSRRQESATAELLEDLTCRITYRIATHDWTHPDFTELISDDYRSYLEYQSTPYACGREAYIANYRAFVDANPAYWIEPICTVADVHENNSTAAVWILLRVSGHPPGVQRESVTIAHWRRKAGRWHAYKQTGIRGAGGCLSLEIAGRSMSKR